LARQLHNSVTGGQNEESEMLTESAVTSLPTETRPQSIEVSGWDAEGQFFVELADLELTDEGEIATFLCHRVSSGSLVFVRLVAGQLEDAYEKGHPVAHEAQLTENSDPLGRCRVQLTRCQPRTARTTRDQIRATRI
jgi:hypothetical protein